MAEQTTEAEPEAPTRYRVTVEFLNVKTGPWPASSPGEAVLTVIGVYRHGLLPADAPAEDVERLLRKGMIEAVA